MGDEYALGTSKTMICPACLKPGVSTPATASMEIFRGLPPKYTENDAATLTGRSLPVWLEVRRGKITFG
jgi:hypothetical protein